MMFWRNRRKSEQELDAQTRELLNAADIDRIPGTDAVAYNSAADIYYEAGRHERALMYYGLSIDAYLGAERWDSAVGICRKVLRQYPRAVRPRCTLAWLAIGKGMVADGQARIREYAEAARRAQQEPLAVAQLKRMGEVAAHSELRTTVADLLREMGADAAADHLLAGLAGPDAASAEEGESEARWLAVRRAALLGPADLAAGG